MADVKCSKCGNIAHPGGFLGTDYKKWDGEIVCDNCYTELAKATASEREVKEQVEQAARVALNPSNEKNTVASVLQVYAIINAICGLFLALRMADDYYSGAAVFLLFGTVLVASGFIYALGEVIKLLHEIKLNTRKTEK